MKHTRTIWWIWRQDNNISRGPFDGIPVRCRATRSLIRCGIPVAVWLEWLCFTLQMCAIEWTFKCLWHSSTELSTIWAVKASIEQITMRIEYERVLYLQVREQSLSHDFQLSRSKAGMQHSSLQILPMYPTSHYHDMGSYLHMTGPQQKAPPALLNWTHNVWE